MKDHPRRAPNERRDPPRGSATWVVRAGLARWLREQAGEVADGPPVRILDVGCGVKPYYPFFASAASEYIGVDVVENPAAELLHLFITPVGLSIQALQNGAGLVVRFMG